jgi:hypothetical protein
MPVITISDIMAWSQHPLKVILNKPIAAAITYGLDKKVSGEKNVPIFDLGGEESEDSDKRLIDYCTLSRSPSASAIRTCCPVLVPFVVSALGVSVLSVHSPPLPTPLVLRSTLSIKVRIGFYTSIARFRFEEFTRFYSVVP